MIDITTPDWLKTHNGELKPSRDGKSWTVFFAGLPQYLIEPLPAKGKYTCRVTHMVNGKRIESEALYNSKHEAALGGLEDVRRKLGW